jgi:O-antigen biosynthesis protein WbqP
VLKRLIDILLAIALIIVFAIPAIIVSVFIKISSLGGVFYVSRRIGRNGRIFLMPKFRTMSIEAPELATDELKEPEQYITPLGKILRESSFDEMPQIFSVLIGDMSFVGPRPALVGQKELNQRRAQLGIDKLTPGITGWAQINGRDSIGLEQKVILDYAYLCKKNTFFDIQIMILTVFRIFSKKDINF